MPAPTSPAPTTLDTVSIAVALAFSASSASDVTKDALLPALVGKLGGAYTTAVRNFQVAFTPGRRRHLGAEDYSDDPLSLLGQVDEGDRLLVLEGGDAGHSGRRRLATGTVTVTFEVVGSLADLGHANAAAFEAALEADLAQAVSDGSLSADLSGACGCAVAAEGVALAAKQEYPTLIPTLSPTPSPTHQPTRAPSHLPTPSQAAPGRFP